MLREEIDSYIENMAIENAKSQDIDEPRILGMRWILTWKTVSDENRNSVSDPTELEREIYGDSPSDVKEELEMNPKDVFRIWKAV